MTLATGALKDMKIRHLDFEQAYLMADIDAEINIKLPEEYREFPNIVRRLNKAIYDLLQSGHCWNLKLICDLTVVGFE